jgi:hypothetical protein
MTILIIIIIMTIIGVIIVSSSTHHAFRPIRYRLEHVLPAPDAAIHPHLRQSQRSCDCARRLRAYLARSR